MKKTIKAIAVAAMAMVMGMGMAFADEGEKKTWTNFIGIGCSIPLNETIALKGNLSGTNLEITNQFGFTETYMGFHKNGLAVKVNLDTAFNNVSPKLADKSFNFTCGLGLGVGYVPVNTKHFVLGVFANAGFDMNLGVGEAYTWKENGKTVTGYNTGVYVAPYVGGNVTGIVTFNKVFSLWGSCDVGCLLNGGYGTGVYNSETKKSGNTNAVETGCALRVVPSFGLGWKF